ncbi:acyl-CoA thioester hydrolase [Glutamicibacter mysorens]|uniref:Acyl-CoA thioester hydrolase n=1 Tax=Glutamicibacter mysorens TaxID=257984 RepID=A0ABX4MUT1_9MICC|nr:thioesterase family protein [Glutamicibacter mysorens]PJJ42902.1 acyl-CoA thioester hydrolase [Glutamicibacter mysorens]
MDGTTLRVQVPMRWGDMDAYGHVNNVNLIRLMEEARIAGFGVPGGTGAPGVQPQADIFSAVPVGTQILVVEHRVRYSRPLEYRNVPVNVDLWVANIKPASFDICYEFRDPVEDHLCVKAATTLAYFDPATARVQRLSPEERAGLSAYEGPSTFPK